MAEPDTTPDPEQAESPAAEAGDAAADAVERAAESVSEAGDALAGDLMDSAGEAVREAAAMPLPDFGASAGDGRAPIGLDLLSDVSLNVKIELGRTRMFVEDVLRLSSGAVVELDKLAGDPVDIYVNDRRVARGEVLVVNDNFCVRVSEIIATPGDDDAKPM